MGDVRRVKQGRPAILAGRMCCILEMPRLAVRPSAHLVEAPAARGPDRILPGRARREAITEQPTYGYRRLWRVLPFRVAPVISKSTGCCIPKAERLFYEDRRRTRRRRVHGCAGPVKRPSRLTPRPRATPRHSGPKTGEGATQTVTSPRLLPGLSQESTGGTSSTRE